MIARFILFSLWPRPIPYCDHMFLKVFTSVKNLAEMVSKSEIFQVRIIIHIMKSITIIIIKY